MPIQPRISKSTAPNVREPFIVGTHEIGYVDKEQPDTISQFRIGDFLTYGAENPLFKTSTFPDIEPNDWELYIAKGWTLNSPQAKGYTVNIPSMDGLLDLTEALVGEVKFFNRELKFMCYSDRDYVDFSKFVDRLENMLHGRKFRIEIPKEPDHFLIGRVAVESTSWEGYGTINFICECEPWLYHYGFQTIEVTGTSGTAQREININVSRKSVSPVIIVAPYNVANTDQWDANNRTVRLVVNEMYEVTLGRGRHEYHDILLRQGANKIIAYGGGQSYRITLGFREGKL